MTFSLTEKLSGIPVMLWDLQKKRNKGFASIVEVIVTAIIFILATAGILSTVSMLRPHGQESSKKIEAAYLGKGIIDNLRKEVAASTTSGQEFFGPNLTIGTHNLGTIDGYAVSYTVTKPAGTDVHKLVMTITWPDP